MVALQMMFVPNDQRVLEVFGFQERPFMVAASTFNDSSLERPTRRFPGSDVQIVTP